MNPIAINVKRGEEEKERRGEERRGNHAETSKRM